jgi:hypothetical protein
MVHGERLLETWTVFNISHTPLDRKRNKPSFSSVLLSQYMHCLRQILIGHMALPVHRVCLQQTSP